MQTPQEITELHRKGFEILKRIVSAGHTDDDAMEALEEGFQLVEEIQVREEACHAVRG